MKTSYLKAFTLTVLSFAYITACNAPTDSGSASDSLNDVASIEDLNIPANFDWKTQKDITFELRGYQTSSVRLVSEDGTVYHHANLIDNDVYSFELSVPAYMDKIRVMYRGQQEEFDLSRSEISHSFEPQNS